MSDIEAMKIESCWNFRFVRLATPRFPISVVALFAIIVVLVGCQSKHSEETAKPPDISGIYILETINGNNLPSTPPHKGGAPLITSGAFTINPDSTCTSKILFALPSGKISSHEVSATYKREGNTLHMRWRGAGRTVGTLDGDLFTMNNEGTMFAYRKQP